MNDKTMKHNKRRTPMLTRLPARLEAGAQVTFNLAVRAGASAPAGTIALELVITESHGFVRKLPITLDVSADQALLKVTPQLFELGITAGDRREQVVTVENTGFATLNGVAVTAPTLPWVRLLTAGQLGDIQPGGSASFTIICPVQFKLKHFSPLFC